MGLPTFSTEQLTSPMMEGALTGRTASLMASEGEALAKRIEEISVKAEAQAKAPAIATAYGDALTRIASGDLSGFQTLEQANALAAGNPFLESMAKDAHGHATQLASKYFDAELQKNSFTNQAALQTERLDAQSKLQNNVMDREEERQKAILDRQALDDHRALQARIESEDAKRLQVWQQDEQAKKRQAELDGKPYNPSQPPAKTPIPPAPKLMAKAYGGGALPGLDMGDTPASINNNLELPSKDGPSVDPANELGAAANGPTSIIPTKSAVGPVASTGPAAAMQAAGINKTEAAEPLQHKFGGMVFTVPPTEKAGIEKTETIKTSTGSTTYKSDKKDAPQNRFVEALSTIEGQDPSFARWFSDQYKKGNKVAIRVEGEGKNKTYQPYSVKPNNTEEAYGKIDKDQHPTGEKRNVAEAVYKKFTEAQELMHNELRGKVAIHLHASEKEVEAAKKQALHRVETGLQTVEQVNKELGVIGAKLTDEEIKAIEKKKRVKQGMRDWVKENNLQGVGNYDPMIGLISPG